MKFNFKTIGARVGGGAAGGAVSFGVNKLLPNIDPKLRAGLKAVIGAVAPELFPKLKLVDYAGAGLVGAATDNLISSMTTESAGASGIGEDQFADDQFVVDHDFEEVNGIDDDDIMNGVDDPISGDNEVISGDDGEPLVEVE